MKDERYERKGKFAKVVMNSPNAIRNYAIEKERKHKENEINKTLYVTVYLPTTASKTAVKKLLWSLVRFTLSLLAALKKLISRVYVMGNDIYV